MIAFSLRLKDDIELATRAADIAGKALYPQANGVSVPEATFEALAAELQAARMRGADYRLIGDEIVMLMTAAKAVVMHRSDQNLALAERWQRIGELLRAAVEVDLVDARKSLAEGE